MGENTIFFNENVISNIPQSIFFVLPLSDIKIVSSQHFLALPAGSSARTSRGLHPRRRNGLPCSLAFHTAGMCAAQKTTPRFPAWIWKQLRDEKSALLLGEARCVDEPHMRGNSSRLQQEEPPAPSVASCEHRGAGVPPG